MLYAVTSQYINTNGEKSLEYREVDVGRPAVGRDVRRQAGTGNSPVEREP